MPEKSWKAKPDQYGGNATCDLGFAMWDGGCAMWDMGYAHCAKGKGQREKV
jgi:hypothetical protein